jgi:hypothetical protein
MVRGWLDELTSAGHVTGWAVDNAALDRPLAIAILDAAGTEIAWGLAHGYRADLADAGIGTGWCGFRVRLSVPARPLRRAPLSLVDRTTGTPLHRADPPRYTEEADPPIATVAELVDADPTIIGDITQLRGCEPLFSAYIKARGVNAFIRAAYVYVLGRPADEAGLARYGGLIRKAALLGYDLLAILADSDEFRARPRALASPSVSSFPFHCA